MRVVLDTNVLVAALLTPRGAPASVLNAVLNGSVTLLVDERIADEYRDVLFRSKFGFSHDALQPVLDFIERAGEYVVAEPVRVTISDPDDIPFVEVATAAAADYLVTGNLKHFPKREWIVSPSTGVDILRERSC